MDCNLTFNGDITMTVRTLQGFMELLPQEQIVFNHMKSVIAHTYEMFGFAPLDTPVLELAEVLTNPKPVGCSNVL